MVEEQETAADGIAFELPRLSFEELYKIKDSSSSRKNFAARLVRGYFPEEERARCNVRGRGGKGKLNSIKMDIVKRKVFDIWPLNPSETEKTAWAQCVCAIDEANRRLNRKK